MVHTHSPLVCVSYHCREVADLDCIGPTGGVLEETVVGVEKQSREFEEELPLWATIVQPIYML